tara:strand:- start:69 stop:989 length:921 start_codon:yes stop_codon:yes gene_type:complete
MKNNYDELDTKVPLVSILLNCYNASSFISKAIESVLGQTYHNWELVIWDDGSTDNTLQVINNYKDKRIKIFKSLNNIGLGKSRLKAISKLNGKLISILDADDYFEPEKIKKQVDIFNDYPDVSICATWANFYNELNKIIYSFKTRNKEEELKKKLLYINFLPHSSIMYRKKKALDVGWYSTQLEYSQDYDLTLKLLEVGDLHIIDENLTNIFQSKTNMSNLKSFKSLIYKENILLLKKNLMNTSSNSVQDLIKTSISFNMIKFNIFRLNHNFFSSLLFLLKILITNPILIFKIKKLNELDERKRVN